jgi:hypothetical protein
MPEIVFPKYPLLYVFFLLLIVSGCRHNVPTPEKTDCYYLQYEIKYLEDMAGDIPTSILPRKMDAYYSKHYVYTRIDGFFNQFTLVQIADLKRNQVSTLLDFFGTHVSYTGNKGQLPAAVMELEGLEVRFTKDTATLGGFLSERIEVETTDSQYDIYYSPEIKVRHPNISTPYTMVKYPLTSFRIQLSHLKMDLTCKKSEFKSVDYEMFSIPEEYKEVNRAAMEEIINNLFTKD